MAKLKGIFFDQDGVIIDTERDGHRFLLMKPLKLSATILNGE